MSGVIRRLCPGCRVAVVTPPVVRCPRCAAAREQRRGSATARGYDVVHRRLRPEVLERDDYVCRWCGRLATTADHIVPLARGGETTLANLAAACVSCNSARGARMPT